MRHVCNSRKTSALLLEKAFKGDVIWSNQTVKGLLHDLVTLHDEIEVLERRADDWRFRALEAEKEISWNEGKES